MTKQTESWTVLKMLTWTRGYLAEKGVENARLEAEWLLASVLGMDRVGLYVNFEKPLSDTELAAFRGVVARRGRREPLQYILGTQEFKGLDFKVTPAVLIPRHDTETLVDEALRLSPQAKRVLDVGTGSGCIAIALAKALPGADVVGVDASSAALAVASENAATLGVGVTFVMGSLFEALTGQQFDCIVSNPPYIPTADMQSLQPEVRDYEPAQALDGGMHGLDYYRLIIPAAISFLLPGGWLLVETGAGQAGAVGEMFTAAGFGELQVARDPGGIERVVAGKISEQAVSA